jgi:hypothetical protein
MKKASTNPAPSSSTPIDETIQLIARATEALGPIQRLSPLERIRSAKIRRGGHQVVPLIATVATKYGIDAPNISGDALDASLEHVQSLDALLSATAELYATISDAHFSASNGMWSSARSLYGMLKAVAKTNASIATEIRPVEEWFRYRKPAPTPAAESATHATAEATHGATDAAAVAKAPTPVTAPTTG